MVSWISKNWFQRNSNENLIGWQTYKKNFLYGGCVCGEVKDVLETMKPHTKS